jgi:predicted DNA-binding transcriptional regulator AlpA
MITVDMEMAAQPKPTQVAHQHALAAAVARLKAQAVGRDLTAEEMAELDALQAAIATFTRAINRASHARQVPADTSADHRGHELARGPPAGGRDAEILRWKAVSARTGLARATIWRAIKGNRFPRPVQLTSAGAVGWIAGEIDAWVRVRVQERDARQQLTASAEKRGRQRKAVAPVEDRPQTQ